MINDKKKMLILVIVVTIIIGVILVIFIKNSNDKVKDKPNTIIEDGKADSDVLVEDVTFSNITKIFDGGVTTLSAEMLNNTNKTKNFKLEIVLKDDDNKAVKSVMQIIENLEPDRTKILTTGIAGDYSNIKNIEFKVMENE